MFCTLTVGYNINPVTAKNQQKCRIRNIRVEHEMLATLYEI